MAIHTQVTKSYAEKFAANQRIKCYPSLLVADHLLFSVPSSVPVLPIKYYDKNKSRIRDQAANRNLSIFFWIIKLNFKIALLKSIWTTFILVALLFIKFIAIIFFKNIKKAYLRR